MSNRSQGRFPPAAIRGLNRLSGARLVFHGARNGDGDAIRRLHILAGVLRQPALGHIQDTELIRAERKDLPHEPAHASKARDLLLCQLAASRSILVLFHGHADVGHPLIGDNQAFLDGALAAGDQVVGNQAFFG